MDLLAERYRGPVSILFALGTAGSIGAVIVLALHGRGGAIGLTGADLDGVVLAGLLAIALVPFIGYVATVAAGLVALSGVASHFWSEGPEWLGLTGWPVDALWLSITAVLFLVTRATTAGYVRRRGSPLGWSVKTRRRPA